MFFPVAWPLNTEESLIFPDVPTLQLRDPAHSHTVTSYVRSPVGSINQKFTISKKLQEVAFPVGQGAIYHDEVIPFRFLRRVG